MKAYRAGIAEGWEGVPIRYTMYGDGEPTIICCNGLGVSTFFWKYLIRYFAGEHRVITWDYRGHAKSGLPDTMHRSKFTMAANARDLVAVLDACEVDRAVVIGHSMGVQVLLEFWKRFPDRCAGLVPVCGPYGRPLDTFFHLPTLLLRPVFDATYLFATSYPRILERLSRPFLKSRFPIAAARLGIVNSMLMDLEDLQPYMDHLSEMDLEVFYLMAGEMQRHNAAPWLRKIDVPTLVVGGERDLFSPLVLSIEMRDRIPDAELLVLPKGSHTGLVEHPELLNLRLEKFLIDRVVPFLKDAKPRTKKRKPKSKSKKDKANKRKRLRVVKGEQDSGDDEQQGTG